MSYIGDIAMQRRNVEDDEYSRSSVHGFLIENLPFQSFSFGLPKAH